MMGMLQAQRLKREREREGWEETCREQPLPAEITLTGSTDTGAEQGRLHGDTAAHKNTRSQGKLIPEFFKGRPQRIWAESKIFQSICCNLQPKPSAWSSGAQPRYSDLNIPWLWLCWNSPSCVTFLAGTTACLMHVLSLNCRMGSHLSLQISKHCQG